MGREQSTVVGYWRSALAGAVSDHSWVCPIEVDETLVAPDLGEARVFFYVGEELRLSWQR
jgi:hypothetical protein